jgi:hypothetical protein
LSLPIIINDDSQYEKEGLIMLVDEVEYRKAFIFHRKWAKHWLSFSHIDRIQAHYA